MEYSKRLLKEGNAATRYSHRRRFAMFLNLLKGFKFASAMDWGCADGLMLRSLCDQNVINKGIGIDIGPEMIHLSKSLSKNYSNLSFFTVTDFKNKKDREKYDLLICTETLEHVRNSEDIINEILMMSDEKSKVVISVPIEVGPSLMLKQVFRFFANLKKSYGYEKYKMGDLIRAIIFWDVNELSRKREAQVEGMLGHQGFDFRVLDASLRCKFRVLKQVCSPFPLFGIYANSTVYWVLEKI